jgi:hypothetical protein
MAEVKGKKSNTGFRYIYDIDDSSIRLHIPWLNQKVTYHYQSPASREKAINEAKDLRKTLLVGANFDTEFLDIGGCHLSTKTEHVGVIVTSCKKYYSAKVCVGGVRLTKSFRIDKGEAKEKAVAWRRETLLRVEKENDVS